MDAYISISTSVVCSVRRKPNSIRLKSSSIYLIEYPIVKPSASANTIHTLKHIITSIIKYDHNFWIKSYIKRKIPAFKGIASLNFYPLYLTYTTQIKKTYAINLPIIAYFKTGIIMNTIPCNTIAAFAIRNKYKLSSFVVSHPIRT